jgi:hypothetical protein
LPADDQEQPLNANADESQHQQDTHGHRQHAAASGPAGRDSTAVSGNYVANSSTRRGDIVGGDKNSKTAINLGAVAVIIGIVIGVVLAGKWVVEKVADGASSAAVTKDSTCAEYLQQAPADRDAAIKRVGLELHVRGVGSPLMMPEVDYECGNSPNATFGTIMSRQHGY